MKIKLTISVLLILLLLSSCDRDIVVSEPSVDDFDEASIMVSVKDDKGYAIPNVEINLVFYTSLNDDTSISRLVHTDENGEYSLYPYASGGFEAVRIFATLDGYRSYPESCMNKIEGDDQSILCTFTMYEN